MVDNTIEENWSDLLKSLYIKLNFKKIDFIVIIIFAAIGIPTSCCFNGMNAEFISLLVQVYSSCLGFGIGGYAVFATINNQKYLKELMEHPTEENSNLSLYKLHLLVMLKLIIILSITLIGLLIIFFSIKTELLAQLTKILEPIMQEIDIQPNSVIQISNSIGGLILGALIGATIIELKNFIFNIYSTSLTYANFVRLTFKDNSDV